MPKVYQIIEAAHKRIEQGWIQGSMGKSGYGTVVSADNPFACSWCLSGAIDRAIVDVFHRPLGILRDFEYHDYYCANTIITQLLPETIIGWNDKPGRTKGEVLAVLDLALEKAKTLEEV